MGNLAQKLPVGCVGIDISLREQEGVLYSLLERLIGG